MKDTDSLNHHEAWEIARKVIALYPKKIVRVCKKTFLDGYRVEISDCPGDCYTKAINDKEGAEDYFRIFG